VGATVPRNANKENRPRSTRIRLDAYAQLARLDTEGLESCGGGCGQQWPHVRCEHHEVESRFGYALNPARPLDLAIRHALLVIAEQQEYEGVDPADREASIIEASSAGRISPERRNELLAIEYSNEESSIDAAAFELLTARDGGSSVGSSRDRRWRADLDEDEQRERRRLEELRFNGGLTAEDRLLYDKLTEPQRLESPDWAEFPDGLRDDAERVVARRRRRARGKLPRSVRVSPSDRRRRPTFEVPSFREQIGAIATATTPAEIERAVRDFRRAAKRRGVLPAGHDRRRGGSGLEQDGRDHADGDSGPATP
jgi:hypothetical protein